MLAKCKQILLLIRHPSYYSYIVMREEWDNRGNHFDCLQYGKSGSDHNVLFLKIYKLLMNVQGAWHSHTHNSRRLDLLYYNMTTPTRWYYPFAKLVDVLGISLCRTRSPITSIQGTIFVYYI